MEDAALIPVEERIHIETLRLLIENAKLRKIVNDYSEGVLRNSLAKVDRRRCLYSVRFDIFAIRRARTDHPLCSRSGPVGLFNGFL
jgi:hypothetical protein